MRPGPRAAWLGAALLLAASGVGYANGVGGLARAEPPTRFEAFQAIMRSRMHR